ncbi:MAG: response regulator transcription factor [Gemmatimonadetes bacterium]|nr:response regulator transcription factor [Gemmatimonadota bacterium]
MSVRVALLDDDDRFRGRLSRRLSYYDEIEVVAEANGVDAFFNVLAKLPEPPDVALLDVELPRGSGMEAAARLASEYPDVGALMLTVFEDPQKIFEAIRAGASGYLLKDAEAEDIVEAVLEVRAGGAPLSRGVARRILTLVKEAPAPRTDDDPPPPDLSPREIELLQQIVLGHTEAAIAERLGISPHTVRTHVKNIYKKLQVHSRAAAVRVTLERGLLDT